MKIKYIKARNFLSIGEDPVEIDFTKYGNIVNIKGMNLDVGKDASNGSGKTSLISIIPYALYGKLIKGLNHKEAINIKSGEALEVEIGFDIGDDRYRVIRKRKPDRLEFWKNGKDESVGGIPSTQEEINKVIRLNYNSFVNVVCFGQHNTAAFLASDPADKRAIAENLLSLDKYQKYCKFSKDKRTSLNDKIKTLNIVYEKLLNSRDANERQIKSIAEQQVKWHKSRTATIEQLQQSIKLYRIKLSNTDEGSALLIYEHKQKELEQVCADLEKHEEFKVMLRSNLDKAEDKIDSIKETKQSLAIAVKEMQYHMARVTKEMQELRRVSNDLEDRSGSRCPVCFGIVEEENFKHVLKHNHKKTEELSAEMSDLQSSLADNQVKLNKTEEQLQKLKLAWDEGKAREVLTVAKVRELNNKKMELSKLSRPDSNSNSLLLEQKIHSLEEQLSDRVNEADPYVKIMENANLELEKSIESANAYKREIISIEEELPYYEFWIEAFGDNGIRSFVIDEVIPMLNARVNYWLQFLIDNKIKLSFNNQLEETIERNPSDGDPFVYNAMSGGEHRRIDLAISQAFAHVMMLTSGACPSICCLDEIGTNLDRPGIAAIYKMICELSRDRQVLVTTHDPDLQELLQGYDTITAIKENGYTRISPAQHSV
jgi:DNA repair exonuclease SbcCD ATPase subunit